MVTDEIESWVRLKSQALDMPCSAIDAKSKKNKKCLCKVALA